LLNGASGNTLSGLTLGQNAGSGVFIAGPGTEGNVISRSIITSNAAGVAISSADRNSVGDDPFSRNVIHHNRGDGIEVLSGRFNRLAPNDVYSNDGLAIDLGGDGTTPNDPVDADTGANDLQNQPVVTSAVWEGDRLKVSGAIRTRPNMAVRVDLYADPRGGSDPGADGEEGRYFLGSVEVTSGPDGSTDFAASLPASESVFSASLSPGGYLITATATARQAGASASESETSEFSPGVEGPVFARVTGLLVNGSAWRPVFREHLAARQPQVSSARYGFGFDSDTIGLPLPWVNIDEISIRFSADVRVEQDDLIVSGRRVPRYAVRSFRYDTDTLTATWRMARPFAYDRVTLVLDSGDDGVRTVRGNVPLDGEARAGKWPSGDGIPHRGLPRRRGRRPAGDPGRPGHRPLAAGQDDGGHAERIRPVQRVHRRQRQRPDRRCRPQLPPRVDGHPAAGRGGRRPRGNHGQVLPPGAAGV